MANASLKRVLVGRALASHKAEHQLLPKVLALPDLLVGPALVQRVRDRADDARPRDGGGGRARVSGSRSRSRSPCADDRVVSYRQTVRAYPNGGGSYIVAHENLGTLPGLMAAAALLIDYVLTVAVSVVAGLPRDHVRGAAARRAQGRSSRSDSSCLLTLANLRGVKEAGTLFAVPTYGFVAMVYVMLGIGFVRCLTRLPQAETADLPLEATATVSLFLILRAFSSGATALTGVEAIADGVQAFRRPASPRTRRRRSPMMLAHDGDDVHRDHPPLRPVARPRERRDRRVPIGPLADRRDGVRPDAPVLPPPGSDRRDPHPRRQHVVSGLPETLRHPGARSVHAVPVPEPRATGSCSRTGSSSSPWSRAPSSTPSTRISPG